jgi:hypothetical protein
MKRETRLNLIFLGLFLAVSLPGAVILFKKKLEPGSARMFMPDAVREHIPYMTPLATGPEVRRFVPPLTGEWLGQLAHDRAGGAAVLTHEGHPVMSDDWLLQAIATRPGEQTTDVWMILWDSRAANGQGSIDVSVDGTAAVATEVERIPVPAAVVQELKSSGYPQPPTRVIWLKAAVPIRSDAARLNVRYGGGQTATVTSVKVFTR